MDNPAEISAFAAYHNTPTKSPVQSASSVAAKKPKIKKTKKVSPKEVLSNLITKKTDELKRKNENQNVDIIVGGKKKKKPNPSKTPIRFKIPPKVNPYTNNNTNRNKRTQHAKSEEPQSKMKKVIFQKAQSTPKENIISSNGISNGYHHQNGTSPSKENDINVVGGAAAAAVPKKKKPFLKPKLIIKDSPKSPTTKTIQSPKSTTKSQIDESNFILTNICSIKAGQQLFSWILKPRKVDEFMKESWEKMPLLIARKCSDYYSELISTNAIDRMLRENRIEFTKNIDITSYKNGQRETHNPEGRAMPPVVWDFYGQGCSIRLLNPQTFIPSIHSMNATLQEYFQCMTGANVYLTPANSQGFAPHYDDIEAFVLQIEGKKHWKIYKPRNINETLPRVSSTNFTQKEIGKPIMEITLEAGDLLYFPRGYIHQATTVPGHHSLHITLSVYQKHSYADLLEILLPMALQQAISENVSLRQGLPLNIWQCMGLVNNDEETTDEQNKSNIVSSSSSSSTTTATSLERTQILKKLKSFMEIIFKSAPIDDAVDQMALRYQHDALPVYLTPAERARTVYGTQGQLITDGENAGGVDQPIVELDTKLRLIRKNILRLVRYKDEEFRIYYHSDNSKEYHEYEQNFIGIDSENAPAVEVLIKAYPEYITPIDLQLEDNERALAVAQDLWERGLLMTENILD